MAKHHYIPQVSSAPAVLPTVTEAIPPTCGTCFFWRKIPDNMIVDRSGGPRGKCHRFPQTVDKFASDFCGEFRLDSKANPSDSTLKAQA